MEIRADNRAVKTLGAGSRRACLSCTLSAICLPVGLTDDELARLDALMVRRPPLRRGEILIRSGEPFSLMFAVRTGALKGSQVDREGRERVLNFYLPGQIIGMESIYPGIYQCDVVALDTASVCEFSYPELNRLASDHPELQERVLRLLSQDLHHAYLMLTNERTAEERLAAFLLEMANRQQDHGWSAHSLVLPMSRRDLASYLGLATETVSRLFSRLQADGLITAARRQIILHDLNRLGERARISDYKFCQ